MCIDISGFAKGYAVDKAASLLLHQCGIANVNMTAGGALMLRYFIGLLAPGSQQRRR